jgi:hypothetical protein
MKIDKLDLLSKGWSSKEIADASRIIQEAEDKKHVGIRFLDSSIYWALLFVLIVANIICSIFLTPFIFTIRNYALIFIVALLGFIFGVMFSILISDIEKIEHKNNRKLLLTLVLSGLINFGLIINFAIDFSVRTGLALRNNPYLIASIYLFAFLVPHIVLSLNKQA